MRRLGGRSTLHRFLTTATAAMMMINVVLSLPALDGPVVVGTEGFQAELTRFAAEGPPTPY